MKRTALFAFQDVGKSRGAGETEDTPSSLESICWFIKTSLRSGDNLRRLMTRSTHNCKALGNRDLVASMCVQIVRAHEA